MSWKQKLGHESIIALRTPILVDTFIEVEKYYIKKEGNKLIAVHLRPTNDSGEGALRVHNRLVEKL